MSICNPSTSTSYRSYLLPIINYSLALACLLMLPLYSVVALPQSQNNDDVINHQQDPDSLMNMFVVNNRSKTTHASSYANISTPAPTFVQAPGANTAGTSLKSTEDGFRNQILVASSLTPGSSDYHSVLRIEGIESYPSNELTVFDKQGLQLYHQKGYHNNWDGTLKGETLAEGTYYYVLKDGQGGIYSGYIQVHL